jgi:hypothetical protein
MCSQKKRRASSLLFDFTWLFCQFVVLSLAASGKLPCLMALGLNVGLVH